MPFKQKGQTMTLTTDNPQHPCNTVTIPARQYEALMAAAEAFVRSDNTQHTKLVAALRAAGIQIEGE